MNEFTSLIKSSDILVKIMEKLGLLKAQEPFQERAKEAIDLDEHIDIVLANATKIFNVHNNEDYYIITVRGKSALPLIMDASINESTLDFGYERKVEFHGEPLMKFQIYLNYR